ASLDIAEKRLPQDGAFRMRMDQQDIDIRLSTFPTEYGEKVVLRLLRQDGNLSGLADLGVPDDVAQRLRSFVARSHGLVLVTGPTGSGKTSTLYSLLHEIDGRARNIVTLEDPIEYRFEHVIQAQTNPRIGFSFAKGLRAMLRQDPDVIMVGEMRDAETADIAFKAALTGHLVLSTLHTGSAIETFVRLFDMGLERYVVASALHGMLAQRLVRRLCPVCRAEHPASDSDKQILAEFGMTSNTVLRARGCDACHGTGYTGRVGIFELIDASDALKDLVKSERTTRVELSEYLAGLGYRGLRHAGLQLVAQGITSIDEVMRVT
ncbi:MAG: GspE/PulE family protein, partial [Pseudomonadota bacterium]|nr:GspE/PulE family protein [Pseudomonadota bacterium]